MSEAKGKALKIWQPPTITKGGNLIDVTLSPVGSGYTVPERKGHDDPCDHPFEWIGKPFGGCD